MGSRRKRTQSGDTIVEVLIAIVVIASVLAGAFLVSRSSLRSVRDSEEHSQALNLLQGQMELLRAAASQTGTLGSTYTSPTPVKPFCFGSDTTPIDASTAGCKKRGDTQLYTLSIQSQGATDATGNYQFVGTVTWDSLNGGTSQEQLFYKLAVQ